MVLNSNKTRLNSARTEEITNTTAVDAKYTMGYVEAINRWEQSQQKKAKSLNSKSASDMERGSNGAKGINSFSFRFRGMIRAREKFMQSKNKVFGIISKHPDVFKLKNFITMRKETHKNSFLSKEEERKRQELILQAGFVHPETRKKMTNEVLFIYRGD